MAASAFALAPAAAQAQQAPGGIEAAIISAAQARPDIATFYAARGNAPIWLRGSSLAPEAEQLVKLIETAHLDGLDADKYRPAALSEAIRKAWGGSPTALADAELMLSQAFADYVRDVRRPGNFGMLYVDKSLAPSVPTTSAVLQAAAAAPSLRAHLDKVAWMHPMYGQLRQALAEGAGDRQAEQVLRVNLERARALPANPGKRYVLVDAAARLWMYEDGRPVDSMRVVVGKSDNQTPMMAGLIRFAMVNPYWNVPPDLVQDRVAPNVLKQGVSYLAGKKYEVLSGWSEDAQVLDPETIDWEAVAAGREKLRVRQLPGDDNAMGKVKFMFPNERGIYLHDTPDKQLLREESRQFSAGCVRLEDASRLAEWMFGKQVLGGADTDARVDLAAPVPVYITYMTAAPEGERIAFRDDPYKRDAIQMAQLGSRALASR